MSSAMATLKVETTEGTSHIQQHDLKHLFGNIPRKPSQFLDSKKMPSYVVIAFNYHDKAALGWALRI